LISFHILHFAQRAKLKIDTLTKAEQKKNMFYKTFPMWIFIVGMCFIGRGFRQLSLKIERISTALQVW
jgi:hypothetical protein